MPPDATVCCAEDAALGLLGQAGVVAVRVADLACPARQGQGRPDSADTDLRQSVVVTAQSL